MTFPVRESVTGTTGDTNESSNFDFDLPATINAGDVLVAIIAARTARAGGELSGWTELFYGTDSMLCAVWIKDATGVEGSTETASWPESASTISVQCLRLTGTTASDVEAAFSSYGISAAPSPPSLTHTGSGDILWLAGAAFNDDESSVTAYSSGFTGGVATYNRGGTNSSSGVANAYLEDATSSKTPGDLTLDQVEGWYAFTLGALGEAGGTTGDIIQSIAGYGGIAGPGGIAGRSGGIAG